MPENYLIVGDDHFVREKETARIKDKYLSSGEGELNYSAFSPENTEGMMDSLGTLPFLADKRVVCVKGSQDLPDNVMESILAYLEAPSETSVLVMSCDSAYKKKKNYKKLSSLMKVVSADKPVPQTVKGWIRKFFEREGIEITGRAVDLIAELKGADTTGIKSELDKLAGFSGGERIEVEHVESMVGRSVTETVFKLVDAINARKAGWAFRILNDLYDQKKQPQEIIGYLGWYLRVMQKIALLTGRGLGPAEIVREVGYKPGYARRLIEQSRKYPVSRIDRWLGLIFAADRDMKTGRRPAALAVEMLVVALMEG